MRAKLNILSALVVGITAGVIAGCQTYDFEPVEPLALGQTTVLRKVEARGLKPNMMLLVDTSGSMGLPVTCSTPPCPSRWTELQGAMNSFLTQSGTVARLGLTTYPQTTIGTLPQACTASSQVQKDLPAPTVEETDAQLQARAAEINATLQGISGNTSAPAPKVIGGTPTSLSLSFVGNQATLLGTDREDLVLLLTDGLPNCNPSNPASGVTNPAACRCTLGEGNCTGDAEFLGCLDKDVSVQQVAALAAKGIRTIVIGFGAETASGAGPETLNAMAQAGGFARTCPPNDATCPRFYPAQNQAELAAALADISERVGTVDPCIVALTPEQLPSDPNLLVVKLTADGVTRTAELNTDYQLTPSGVEMIGATCERIKQSTPLDPVTLEVFAVQAK